tara:strand:+ start:367 stop:546 length:180 start_codon:yes stop_codon:yes gene_type:complete
MAMKPAQKRNPEMNNANSTRSGFYTLNGKTFPLTGSSPKKAPTKKSFNLMNPMSPSKKA